MTHRTNPIMAILLCLLPLLLVLTLTTTGTHATSKPNIILIISDDQDLHLGSLSYMPNVQSSIISSGLLSTSHFGPTPLCCPARATLLRGQTAHNTNITHVGPPGGAYRKFLNSGQMDSYLPVWLQEAGYRTGYLGKFMNGFNSRTPEPPGWDEQDLLTAPWIYDFNHVVMRRNGEKPVEYPGWHQTDVLRMKALALVEKFTEEDGEAKPFYLEIAPVSPHVRLGGFPTVPLERHKNYFPGVGAPRMPNWNPPDYLHQGKPGWVGELEQMSDDVIEMVDKSMRARLQGLQGVDEIVDDVVELLEKKGLLENTYSTSSVSAKWPVIKR